MRLYRAGYVVWLLAAACLVTGTTVQADVIALKRDAGLNPSGAIAPQFAGATVVTTTVSDSDLYDLYDARWANVGRGTMAYGDYVLYKFDLSAVPGLANSQISVAQLRIYHTMGNGGGSTGMVLTHDWLEGPGLAYWNYPGAAGGVSLAHPIGYNTGANQGVNGDATPPLQTWGPNSDSMFSVAGDLGPMQTPSSSPIGEGFTVIDVTADVQAWVSGSKPNYGWGQIRGNYTFHMSEAASDLQPVLFIEYVPEPMTLALLAITCLAGLGRRRASCV